ncbi:MAG: VWA domain-containing protein, partial [Thermodesulfobacteriota bacterium]
MEKVLVEFAGRLRAAGVPVSPAEVLDAGQAMRHLGLEERETFKSGLRAVMVKSGRDIPVFDAVFDLFFIRGPRPDQAEAAAARPALDMSAVWSELLDMYQPEMSLVSELIMTGRFAALTRMLLGRGQGLGMDRMESPLQGGFFLRRLRREMDLDRVREDRDRFLALVEEAGLPPEQVRSMRAYVEENLGRLEREVKGLVERELARNRYQFLRRLEEEELSERPLVRMSEAEILATRSAVARLARRLKERLSLRYHQAEAGRLDLKAMLRKNVGLGGPLPRLRFRDQRPGRPQVAALCDVSNSVRNFSRFMLLFLYTLKEVVARVRSFIFVGDLTEVTDLFRRRELG